MTKDKHLQDLLAIQRMKESLSAQQMLPVMLAVGGLLLRNLMVRDLKGGYHVTTA